MKKRNIAGGIVVGVVLFSIFGGLGMLPGLGTGSSDGTNNATDGSKTQVSAADSKGNPADTTPASASTDKIKASAKKDETQKPDKPEAVPETKIVELLVHETGIGIGYNDGKYRGGTMEEAIELAKKATGNEDGIKVRIMRDRLGRLALWSRLEEELHRVGIKSDEIVTPRELLDLNKKKEETEAGAVKKETADASK